MPVHKVEKDISVISVFDKVGEDALVAPVEERVRVKTLAANYKI